jgi:hypothetical protein
LGVCPQRIVISEDEEQFVSMKLQIKKYAFGSLMIQGDQERGEKLTIDYQSERNASVIDGSLPTIFSV